MARAITAAELIKLRKNGQDTQLHLIIDRPATIYTARATGAVAQAGAWTIGFDGGSGTLADCLADMTLLIGSSAGASDIGIARLRKAPVAGTFYIGADPSLEVEDDDYLTVIDSFESFARHPVGTSIDVDDAYGDEFTNFYPYPIMGDPAVIAENETVTFDATDCWVPGSTITSYAWIAATASGTADMNTATPDITYDTSGRHRVKLTVTAANGKSYVGYRYVYVLGTNLAPEAGVIFGEPQGDGDGWTCEVTLFAQPTGIHNGCRAILYADDRYGTEAVSIGPYSGRENVVLVGWVLEERIIDEPGLTYYEYTIGGASEMLKRINTLPAGLTDTSLPSDDGTDLPAWAKLSSLTVAKGLHYLLFARSTLARCLDVRVEDWSWPAPKLTSEAGNLWEQLRDFAGSGAETVTSDRYSRIEIERDAQLYPLASRAADIPVVMTLTDADWQGELTAIRRQAGEACMAEAEGHTFSGGILTQVGGRSPGNQPSRFGDLVTLGNDLCFSTAGDSLSLAGLLAGWKNSEYETILVTLAMNNRMIDLCPRQYVIVTVGSDTLYCVPRRIRLRHGDGNFLFTDLELEPRGGQWPAVAITYPGEGEPPIEPPDEPPEDPPEPPEDDPGDGDDPEEPSDTDAVVATSSDVRTSANLDQASPTWTTELA